MSGWGLAGVSARTLATFGPHANWIWSGISAAFLNASWRASD